MDTKIISIEEAHKAKGYENENKYITIKGSVNNGI